MREIQGRALLPAVAGTKWGDRRRSTQRTPPIVLVIQHPIVLAIEHPSVLVNGHLRLARWAEAAWEELCSKVPQKGAGTERLVVLPRASAKVAHWLRSSRSPKGLDELRATSMQRKLGAGNALVNVH